MQQVELVHQKSLGLGEDAIPTIKTNKIVRLQTNPNLDTQSKSLNAQIDALKQEKTILNERLTTLADDKEHLQADYR